MGGILLIVAGAYLLNIQRFDEGILSPIKALFEERGPVLMLSVAFIWSITANVDKIGVLNSSPIFYSFTLSGALTVGLFIAMHLRSKKYPEQIKRNLRGLVPIGLFFSLGILSQMTAIEMTLAPFVIAIKRTSILIGSIYGFVVFKESNLRERLLGASIMILGLLMIIPPS
jgi:uncharacterized membrane protein